MKKASRERAERCCMVEDRFGFRLVQGVAAFRKPPSCTSLVLSRSTCHPALGSAGVVLVVVDRWLGWSTAVVQLARMLRRMSREVQRGCGQDWGEAG